MCICAYIFTWPRHQCLTRPLYLIAYSRHCRCPYSNLLLILTRRWPVQARVAATEFKEFPWHFYFIQNITKIKRIYEWWGIIFRNGRRVHRLILFFWIIWCSPLFLLTPPPSIRQCIDLFVVAEGWLLLDIGWFVLFLIKTYFLFGELMYTLFVLTNQNHCYISKLNDKQISLKLVVSFPDFSPWISIDSFLIFPSTQNILSHSDFALVTQMYWVEQVLTASSKL